MSKDGGKDEAVPGQPGVICLRFRISKSSNEKRAGGAQGYNGPKRKMVKSDAGSGKQLTAILASSKKSIVGGSLSKYYDVVKIVFEACAHRGEPKKAKKKKGGKKVSSK